MKVLYFYLLATIFCEIIVDIISYVLVGNHNVTAISIAFIYSIITIMVYVYDKFFNKDK